MAWHQVLLYNPPNWRCPHQSTFLNIACETPTNSKSKSQAWVVMSRDCIGCNSRRPGAILKATVGRRTSKVQGEVQMKEGKEGKTKGSMAIGLRVLMAVVVLWELPGAATATEYTVGDATGWDFAPTTSYYADWASGHKFLPGDKLVFKYLPSAHNVQEVTEADYVACNSVNPIAEYESGDDIVTLPKPGTHYYICGFLGHCDQGGMKMKATVISPTATTNAPSPSPSPTKSPELPSPMTSIVPQLPGGETPFHGPRGHGHGTPPPTAAPISTPGSHSRAAPHFVPFALAKLLLLSLGMASAFLFW